MSAQHGSRNVFRQYKEAKLPLAHLAFIWSALLLLLCACNPTNQETKRSQAAASSSPNISGGVVAADQPISEKIGNHLLAEGGNAMDAAVTTALALGVENPSSSGLGGGGFALIWHAKTQRLYALDFRERAPSKADPAHYRSMDGEVLPERAQLGCLAAGVPGELAGLAALHRRFGKLSWQEVVSPAAELAQEGAPVTPYLARASKQMAEKLEAFPESAKYYLQDNGSPLRTGAIRTDPLLANTLHTIAQKGAQAFYRGVLAKDIAQTCENQPGSITVSDLANYKVRWRQPVQGTFLNRNIASMPPPSSGGAVLIEILNIIEPLFQGTYHQRQYKHVDYYATLAEAMKHGFADRATYFGDPDFVDVPVSRLTSKSYAKSLRQDFSIDPKPRDHYGGQRLGREHPSAPPKDSGTSHISIIDNEGNAVALTTSVNYLFGSLVRVPKVGIVLNNTMDDFALAPGVPNVFGLVQSEANAIEPNKRPLSSMTPTIILNKRNEVIWVAGASGGPRIISGTLQASLNTLLHGMGPKQAIRHPRIHHQWVPEKLWVERTLDPKIRLGLEELGHQVFEIGSVGVVQGVWRNADGTLTASSDLRKRK